MKKRELLNINVPIAVASSVDLMSKLSGLPRSRVIALALLEMECMVQSHGIDSYWDMVGSYQEGDNVRTKHITCSIPKNILERFVSLCKQLNTPKNVVANIALFHFITNKNIASLKLSYVPSCYGTKYIIRVDKIFKFFDLPFPEDWNEFLQTFKKNISFADKLTFFCGNGYLSIYLPNQRYFASTIFFVYEYMIHLKYPCDIPFTKNIRQGT